MRPLILIKNSTLQQRTGISMTMLMLASSILLVSCRGVDTCKEPVRRSFKLDGFREIFSGSHQSFTILKGDEFKFFATGCASDLEDLVFTVKDSILDIRFSQHKPTRYKIDFIIYTPLGAEVQFFKTPRIRKVLEPSCTQDGRAVSFICRNVEFNCCNGCSSVSDDGREIGIAAMQNYL